MQLKLSRWKLWSGSLRFNKGIVKIEVIGMFGIIKQNVVAACKAVTQHVLVMHLGSNVG